MNNEYQRLWDEVTIAQNTLKGAQRRLQIAVRSCKHDWVTVYDPIITKGYTIPSDPPGTMGVDWHGAVYVPDRTEKRWKRTCKNCGAIQYTNEISEETIEHPVFKDV